MRKQSVENPVQFQNSRRMSSIVMQSDMQKDPLMQNVRKASQPQVESLVPHNEIFSRSKHAIQMGTLDNSWQNKPTISKRFSTINSNDPSFMQRERLNLGQAKPSRLFLNNEKLDVQYPQIQDLIKQSESLKVKKKDQNNSSKVLTKLSPDRPHSKVELRQAMQTTPKVPIQISQRGSTLIELPSDLNHKLRSP